MFSGQERKPRLLILFIGLFSLSVILLTPQPTTARDVCFCSGPFIFNKAAGEVLTPGGFSFDQSSFLRVCNRLKGTQSSKDYRTCMVGREVGASSQVSCESADAKALDKSFGLEAAMKAEWSATIRDNIFEYVNVGVKCKWQEDKTEDLRKSALDDLNPANIRNPSNVIGRFLAFMLYPLGSIVLALYVWAGFLWMTSGGNADRTKKALHILVWTSLGAAATLGSYLITRQVIEWITR